VPYRFLEDVSIADVAFEAWGDTVEAMFVASAEATLNVMVADLKTVARQTRRSIRVEADALDLLLFNFLQELIYYKDAERLLLLAERVQVETGRAPLSASAVLAGEALDAARHDLLVDVKAVTLHRFQVAQSGRGWEAFVILDI
jgi:SHS2 domain-containing protein